LKIADALFLNWRPESSNIRTRKAQRNAVKCPAADGFALPAVIEESRPEQPVRTSLNAARILEKPEPSAFESSRVNLRAIPPRPEGM